MLRVRVITLGAHNVYSANHDDPLTLKQVSRSNSPSTVVNIVVGPLTCAAWSYALYIYYQ